jgi:hypothetical protein
VNQAAKRQVLESQECEMNGINIIKLKVSKMRGHRAIVQGIARSTPSGLAIAFAGSSEDEVC